MALSASPQLRRTIQGLLGGRRSDLTFEVKEEDSRKRQHFVTPLTSKFGYAGVSRRMNG
jgi:hypothetical protein